MFYRVALTLSLVLGAIHSEGAEPLVFCQQRWREMDLEGMKIRLYRLRAESFPPGESYKLIIRNFDGAETELFTYVVNKKGHLILDLREDLKKAAPFIVTPLRRGEKVTYGMLSQDGSLECSTQMIPFPIESVKGDLVLSIELLDVKGESFVCRGAGFLPNEELCIACLSEGQSTEHPIVSSSNGSFELLLKPAVMGLDSGKSEVTVTRKKEKSIHKQPEESGI